MLERDARGETPGKRPTSNSSAGSKRGSAVIFGGPGVEDPASFAAAMAPPGTPDALPPSPAGAGRKSTRSMSKESAASLQRQGSKQTRIRKSRAGTDSSARASLRGLRDAQGRSTERAPTDHSKPDAH